MTSAGANFDNFESIEIRRALADWLLIYPRWAPFQEALPLFDFGGGLTLRVLPFDLEWEFLLDAELTSLPLCSPGISEYLKVGA